MASPDGGNSPRKWNLGKETARPKPTPKPAAAPKEQAPPRPPREPRSRQLGLSLPDSDPIPDAMKEPERPESAEPSGERPSWIAWLGKPITLIVVVVILGVVGAVSLKNLPGRRFASEEVREYGDPLEHLEATLCDARVWKSADRLRERTRNVKAEAAGYWLMAVGEVLVAAADYQPPDRANIPAALEAFSFSPPALEIVPMPKPGDIEFAIADTLREQAMLPLVDGADDALGAILGGDVPADGAREAGKRLQAEGMAALDRVVIGLGRRQVPNIDGAVKRLADMGAPPDNVEAIARGCLGPDIGRLVSNARLIASEAGK